jgi:hypothetical protein
MNAIDRVRALFVEGEEVECVRNTYIPDRDGQRRRVVKVGRTVVECECDGKPYRMELPTRVGDVVEVDEQQATWKMRPAGHTVTIRRIGA